MNGIHVKHRSLSNGLIAYVQIDTNLRQTCKDGLGDCKFHSKEIQDQQSVRDWTQYYADSVRGNQWIGVRNFLISVFCLCPEEAKAREAYINGHQSHEDTGSQAVQQYAKGEQFQQEGTGQCNRLKRTASHKMLMSTEALDFVGRQWHLAVLQSIPLWARAINLLSGGYCTGGYAVPEMPTKYSKKQD